MTQFEKLLLFFDDYLKSIKVDYMLFASTLLGIVRDGKMIDGDKEIDVCILAKDIDQKLLDKFGSEGLLKNVFMKGMNNAREEYGMIYLTPEERMLRDKGWMAISPVWLKKRLCYTNIVNSDCMILPRSTHDKENWSTIEYLGRKFKAPRSPKRWLAGYYGEGWATPRPDWHWRNNKNYKQWEELWL